MYIIESEIKPNNDLYGTSWYTLAYSDYFTNYAENWVQPRVKLCGNVAQVFGIITVIPNRTVPAGASVNITRSAMPAKYRPSYNIASLQQGSGTNRWTLLVNGDGTLTLERFCSGSGVALSISSGEWLPFSCTYIANNT